MMASEEVILNADTYNSDKIKLILDNVILQENDLQNKIINIKDWLNLHENAYSQVLSIKNSLLNYNDDNKKIINEHLDILECSLNEINTNEKRFRSKKAINDYNKIETKNKKLLEINNNLFNQNKQLKDKINKLNEKILKIELENKNKIDKINIINGKLKNDIDILNQKLNNYSNIQNDNEELIIGYSNHKKELNNKMNQLNIINSELQNKIETKNIEMKVYVFISQKIYQKVNASMGVMYI